MHVVICKVSFFHGNVSALNSLPDAVDGKESLRVCQETVLEFAALLLWIIL